MHATKEAKRRDNFMSTRSTHTHTNTQKHTSPQITKARKQNSDAYIMLHTPGRQAGVAPKPGVLPMPPGVAPPPNPGPGVPVRPSISADNVFVYVILHACETVYTLYVYFCIYATHQPPVLTKLQTRSHTHKDSTRPPGRCGRRGSKARRPPHASWCCPPTEPWPWCACVSVYISPVCLSV